MVGAEHLELAPSVLGGSRMAFRRKNEGGMSNGFGIMHPGGLAQAQQKGQTGVEAATRVTMDPMRLSVGMEDAS